MVQSLEEVVEDCKGLFRKEFGGGAPIAVKAPGRVNIIGEHTDYNDGFVFPMAIPLYTVIVGKPNGTSTIRLVTAAQMGEVARHDFEAPSAAARLTPGSPKWANYVKGVIEHFPAETVPGFDAAIVTTVPLGGGLSSSASLEVATATFLEALTGKILALTDKALLCQKSEHTFASMPCGIMDQFISCMGKEDSALLIDCRSLETKLVNLASAKPGSSDEVTFLVVNSNVKHQLSGSEYPQRRSDCFEAAGLLGVKSLRDANMTLLRENREKMSDRVYQRALHVVSEIERCSKATDAIVDGDLELFGRLMYQSHVSLRDLYAVSCPELDELVDITMKCKGVYGSRMTGGGFGGCIVALVKSSEAENVIEIINQKYSKKATSYVFKAVDGAAIISQ
jgi:galactokinase